MSISAGQRRPAWAVAIVAAAFGAGCVAAPAARADIVPSQFTQLAGDAACAMQSAVLYPGAEEVDPEDKLPCKEGRALEQAESVVVSADGLTAYVASSGYSAVGSNAVAVFSRDPATGRLEQQSCVSADGGDGRAGSDGACADGDALLGANHVVLSPDGKNAYVTASTSNGLAAFKRDPTTGALEQIGCHKAVPRGDRCSVAPIYGARGAIVSPDGKFVYALAAAEDGISIFSRDATTGKLTFAGCISSDGTDGACMKGTSLRAPTGIANGPDGKFVYVTARYSGVLVAYERDAETGALKPGSCAVAAPPPGSRCATVPSLAAASDIAVAPDGNHVYASASEGTLSILAIDRTTGALTPAGCLANAEATGDDVIPDEEEDEETEDEEDLEEEELAARAAAAADCGKARAIFSPESVTLSADGRSLFVASRYGSSLATFSRNPETGTLTQTGCVEAYLSYRSCALGVAMYGALGLGASPDGKSLYVASRSSNAVVAFGAAVAVAPTARTASVKGRTATLDVSLACPRAASSGCAGTVLASGASGMRTRYALASGRRGRLLVRVPRSKLTAIRGRVARRTTLTATDGSRVLRATRQRVTVR